MSEIEQMRLAALKALQTIFEDDATFTSHEIRVSAAATLLHHTTPQPSTEQWRAAADVMLEQADKHDAAKDARS